MASKNKKKLRAVGSSARVKGRLVEAIVAAMHDAPGVQVKQNVFLPSLTGRGRPPEIDVLIDGVVAGYPVRIAIECKNEKERVGRPRIDQFVGKLDNVGIPRRHGVYVAVSGFTRDALARAKDEGIRTLVLTGLSQERLSEAVRQAMQSVVHLWAVMTQLSVQNNVNVDVKNTEQLATFVDDDGNPIATIPDLTWRLWIENRIPETLGEHQVLLPIPSGWHQMIDGKREDPQEIRVTIHVFGLAVTFPGTARHHELRDAETSVLQKLQLKAEFDGQPLMAAVSVLSSEEALSVYLDQNQASIRVVSRVRLPRMQWNGVFWPRSIKFMQRFTSLLDEEEEGTRRTPDKINVQELEPPSLETMWEPLWMCPSLQNTLGATLP